MKYREQTRYGRKVVIFKLSFTKYKIKENGLSSKQGRKSSAGEEKIGNLFAFKVRWVGVSSSTVIWYEMRVNADAVPPTSSKIDY